jgi:hypothetical protein
MKPGDLVRYQEKPWVVQAVDRYRLGVAVLVNSEDTLEVPFDLDTKGEVEVLANPSEEWPFISPPVRGVITDLRITRGLKVEPLIQYQDWVAAGSSVFFRPTLSPRVGDTFTVLTERGAARVTVRRQTMLTFRQRIEAATKKPPQEEPFNAYTVLLRDDES